MIFLKQSYRLVTQVDDLEMLYDLLVDLICASTPKDKERAYRQLERIGVDRATANALAVDIKAGM